MRQDNTGELCGSNVSPSDPVQDALKILVPGEDVPVLDSEHHVNEGPSISNTLIFLSAMDSSVSQVTSILASVIAEKAPGISDKYSNRWQLSFSR